MISLASTFAADLLDNVHSRIPQKLVIIDPSVDSYYQLAMGVDDEAEVHILDPDRDGIQQITELLQPYFSQHTAPNSFSLHLVSHGSPGCLYLGNTQLNLETIDRYSVDLQSWFSPISQITPVTLMLYGCNVALGTTGSEFVEHLQRLTRAHIVASNTLTGSTALEGNWNFEVITGEVSTKPAFQSETLAAYPATLAVIDTTFTFRDEPFDSNAEVSIPVSVQQLTVQTDGKILGAGVKSNHFALVRHNTDGSLDSSFGSVGSVESALNIQHIKALVQPDGKIVVAGNVFTYGSVDAADDSVVVLRYNSDGTIDTNFGINGVSILELGGGDELEDVSLQPDGSILIAANFQDPDVGNKLAIARFTSSGIADPSFGTDGKVIPDYVVLPTRNDAFRGNRTIIQLDGKAIVAGDDGGLDFILVRYKSDGIVDDTFGSNGIVQDDQVKKPIFQTITIQADGKLLVAGGENSDPYGQNEIVIYRYNSDGTRDISFGTGGTIKLTSNIAYINALLAQTDGKILVSGVTLTPSYQRGTIFTQFNPNGSLDTSFGQDGEITANALGSTFAIQSDRKILSVENGLLARYEPLLIQNLRPTEILMANPRGSNGLEAGIQSGSPNNTVISSLLAGDPDWQDNHTFMLVDDANGRFKLVGDQIQVSDSGSLGAVDSSYTIRVRTTDNGTPAKSYERDLKITVIDTPINISPIIDKIPELVFDEDTPITFTVNITDPDDPISSAQFDLYDPYPNTANFAINGSTIDAVGGAVTVTILPNETNTFGSGIFGLQATNGGTYSVQLFKVKINPIDDAPIVTSPATFSGYTNSPSEFDITLEDVDDLIEGATVAATSDNLVLFPNASISVSGTGSSRTIKLNPATDQAGNAIVTLVITSGSATVTKTVNIGIAPYNDPPSISAIANNTTPVGTPITIPLTVTDPNGDVVTLTAVSSTNTALIPTENIILGGSGSNRTVTITPVTSFSGTSTITLKADDGKGGQELRQFNMRVGSANDPSVSNIANQTVQEDTPRTVSFIVGDANTPLNSLALTTTSNNPTLFPSGSIALSGSGASRSLTLTPALNQSGTATITLNVSDGTTIAPQTFNVTVMPVNDQPIATGLTDQAIFQNGSITIPFTVDDVDTPVASITTFVSSDNTTLLPYSNIVLNGSGTNRTLTLTPIQDQIGDAQVTILVHDGISAPKSYQFNLNVSLTSDPPTVGMIADQTIDEDTFSGAIAFTIADPDTPLTQHTVTAISSNTALFPNGSIIAGGIDANRTLTLSPAANQTGTATITVNVSDGIKTTPQTFNVTVNPVDDAPTLDAIAPQSTEENALKTVDLTLNDIDSPLGNLTIAATSSNQILLPNGNITTSGAGTTRTLRLTPATSQAGTATITVTVSDGSETATKTFDLTVNPLDDPPIVSAIANQTLNEDEVTGAINFTIADIDTPIETLTVGVTSDNSNLLPNGSLLLSGSGTNRTLTLTPATNQNGSAIVSINVSDASRTTTRTFNLAVNAVNDAPTLTAIANQVIDEDQSTNALSFTVGDVETPLANLITTASTDNGSLFPNGSLVISGAGANRTLILTPAANQSGVSTITLNVNDGTATTSQTFNITVNPINDAPTLSAIADQTFDEDAAAPTNAFDSKQGAIALPITIGDAETDPNNLIIQLQSSNPGLIPVNSVNGIFLSGTAGANRTLYLRSLNNQSGTAVITVGVNDGTITTVRNFNVTVNSVNDAPFINYGSGDTLTFNEDTTSSPLSFYIGDVETAATALTISATSSNPTLIPTANIGITGQDGNRTLIVTPAANQYGITTVNVTVSDGDKVITQPFTIDVRPVNDSPTLSFIADQAIQEDLIAIPFTVEDLETAPNTLTVTAESSDLNLIPNDNLIIQGTGTNRTLNIIPASGRVGNAVVTLKVNDGILTTQRSFNVSLSVDSNNPLRLSNSSINENVAANNLVGNLSGNLPNSTSYTYSIVSGTGDTDNSIFAIINNELHIKTSPDFETKPLYNVRVRVSNQAGQVAEKSLAIAINNVNEAPIILGLTNSFVNFDPNLWSNGQSASIAIGKVSAFDPEGDGFYFDNQLPIGVSGDTLYLYEAQLPNSLRDLLQALRFPDGDIGPFPFKLGVTDSRGASSFQTFPLTFNVAPQGMEFNSTPINEDTPVNTVVGSLTTLDGNGQYDNFTYSLVSGIGDTNNSAFRVQDNKLQVVQPLNYEQQSTYSVRVRVTDQGGLTYEQPFSIAVKDVNEAPTDILLNRTLIDEAVVHLYYNNQDSLNVVDPDRSFEFRDPFTYTLVSGDGSDDNSLFKIKGNLLLPDFDYETKSSYKIRLRVADKGGLATEKAVILQVKDIREGASGIRFDQTVAIDENSPAGTVVGTLTALGGDLGDTFDFSNDDSPFYRIVGNTVVLKQSPDYEQRAGNGLQIKAIDVPDRIPYSTWMPITVIDINEPVTVSSYRSIGDTSVSFGGVTRMDVPFDIFFDPESREKDPLLYSFSLADGSPIPSWLGNFSSISYNQRQSATTFPLEFKGNKPGDYDIRITATDSVGHSASRTFRVSVLGEQAYDRSDILDIAQLLTQFGEATNNQLINFQRDNGIYYSGSAKQMTGVPLVDNLNSVKPPNVFTELSNALKDTPRGLVTTSALKKTLRRVLGDNASISIDQIAIGKNRIEVYGSRWLSQIKMADNLEVPGLIQDTNIQGIAKVNYEFSFNFGNDKGDGFYFDTESAKFRYGIEASLNSGAQFSGHLGNLKLTLRDDPLYSTFANAFIEGNLKTSVPRRFGEEIRKKNVDSLLDASDINKQSQLRLQATTQATKTLPSFTFDIQLKWDDSIRRPKFEVNNVRQEGDEAKFIRDFAGPMLAHMKTVLAPFKEQLSFLSTRVTALEDMGIAGLFDLDGDGKVMLIEILGKILGDKTASPVDASDVRFLKTLGNVDQAFTKYETLRDRLKDIDQTFRNIVGGFNPFNSENQLTGDLRPLEEKMKAVRTDLKQFMSVFREATGRIFPEDLASLSSFVDQGSSFTLPKLDFGIGYAKEKAVKEDKADLFKKDPVPVPEITVEGRIIGYYSPQQDPGEALLPPSTGLVVGAGGQFSAKTNLSFGFDRSIMRSPTAKPGDAFYVTDAPAEELSMTGTLTGWIGGDFQLRGFSLATLLGKLGIEGINQIDLADQGEATGQSDGRIYSSEIGTKGVGSSSKFNLNAFLGVEARVAGTTVYDQRIATFPIASWQGDVQPFRKVSAKYLAGATVFLDTNANDIHDENEPLTITNFDGAYTFSDSLTAFDTNVNGKIDPAEGKLVALNGIDTFTTLPVTTLLTAPGSYSMITPVTTLINALTERGIDLVQAENSIKSALGIPSKLDLSTFDPIQAIQQRDINGIKVMQAHVEIQTLIGLVSYMMAGVSESSVSELSSYVIEAIAEQAKQGDSLNLTDTVQLQTLIQNSVNRAQIKEGAQNWQPDLNLTDDTATIAAGINRRFEQAATTNALGDYLKAVSKIQRVALGKTITDLLSVTLGKTPIAQVLAANTGSGFDAALAALDKSAPFNVMVGTEGQDQLVGGSGIDLITAKGGNDRLKGKDGKDILTGNNGRDLLDGGKGDDRLMGCKGRDQLVGGEGTDYLMGGEGKDILTGGKGRDRFSLDTSLPGIDKIMDFSKRDDVIEVMIATSDSTLVSGSLIATKQLRFSKEARTHTDRFLYNRKTGSLSYDADGTGKIQSFQIAQLVAGTPLTAQNITVG